MATITITIPDAVLPRVLDAMCLAGGWTTDLGVTKPVFAKTMIVDYVRQTVRHVEDRTAMQAASAAVADVPGLT